MEPSNLGRRDCKVRLQTQEVLIDKTLYNHLYRRQETGRGEESPSITPPRMPKAPLRFQKAPFTHSYFHFRFERGHSIACNLGRSHSALLPVFTACCSALSLSVQPESGAGMGLSLGEELPTLLRSTPPFRLAATALARKKPSGSRFSRHACRRR